MLFVSGTELFPLHSALSSAVNILGIHILKNWKPWNWRPFNWKHKKINGKLCLISSALFLWRLSVRHIFFLTTLPSLAPTPNVLLWKIIFFQIVIKMFSQNWVNISSFGRKAVYWKPVNRRWKWKEISLLGAADNIEKQVVPPNPWEIINVSRKQQSDV